MTAGAPRSSTPTHKATRWVWKCMLVDSTMNATHTSQCMSTYWEESLMVTSNGRSMVMSLLLCWISWKIWTMPLKLLDLVMQQNMLVTGASYPTLSWTTNPLRTVNILSMTAFVSELLKLNCCESSQRRLYCFKLMSWLKLMSRLKLISRLQDNGYVFKHFLFYMVFELFETLYSFHLQYSMLEKISLSFSWTENNILNRCCSNMKVPPKHFCILQLGCHD